MQRALMQFFKPANWFTVREALIERRATGPDRKRVRLPHTGPAPEEAIVARRCRANDVDHYHSIANPAKGEKRCERGTESIQQKGYRPSRKSATRYNSNTGLRP